MDSSPKVANGVVYVSSWDDKVYALNAADGLLKWSYLSATIQVALLAFPDGNVYMQMRDALGRIYEDELFAPLYAAEGHPALQPWQLALISIMQFAENLSDRQAAEAVRARIDWKYALSLELTDAGFHYSVLSEFRTRLVKGGLEQELLDRLLAKCRAHGWLKARGQQPGFLQSSKRGIKRVGKKAPEV